MKRESNKNITVGHLLSEERKRQQVSEQQLIEGLGTRAILNKLENNQVQCEKMLLDILLQRLGRSPDKLEYILTWGEYREECTRDWLEECVFKKNKKWAERALQFYMERKVRAEAVQQMYYCRGRAMIAYWIDEDKAAAETWLMKALNHTFPRWKEASWEKCRISTIELENVLALVRVRQECGQTGGILLNNCRAYIDASVTDGEENAKIYSKYAWLAAREECMKKQPEKALALCTEALERLREYCIEYFMRPLLGTIIECRELFGVSPKAEGSDHYREYLSALCHLHEQFGESWYPVDSVLHNCCQKAYHLDFEIIRAERYAHDMTQEMVADEVYASAKEITKIEHLKSSPRGRHLAQLLEKFGLEKERQNGLVVTDSFEMLELRKQISGFTYRRQYDAAKPLLQRLRSNLNMQQSENQRIVWILQNMIDIAEEKCSYNEILEKDWEMLGETYKLSPERLQSSPKIKKNRGKEGEEITYRAPLRNEAGLINQIAILLIEIRKKEEAIRIYEWAVETFERSRVKTKYRYHLYVALKSNLAAELCSILKSRELLQYELYCGKAGELGSDYLTMACAMIDDSSNREICRKMLKEVYYLLELSNAFVDQRVVRKYYREKYDGDITDT